MRDMVTGIPIGMAIGLGSGIATGIASGQGMARKNIADRIRELGATHTISIQKPDGTYMTLDEFIKLATSLTGQPVREGKKKALLIAVLVGLLLLAAGALFLFMKLRS